MTQYRFSALMVINLLISGCAVTSGLQTYDLPPEGKHQTDSGTQVNVVKLSQENISALNPAQINSQQLDVLFNTPHKNYVLSSGDILSIYLWAYPEITPPISSISSEQSVTSNGYQIDQQGYIQFPIIGRFKAAGKSLQQVNIELQQKLKHYLKTPDVIVRVLSYQGQRFSVQGNVMKGGQFYLTDQPTSVYTALGMAGGINALSGDSSALTLVRNGRTYHLNSIELEKTGYSLHQLLIQPNDTLYVNAKDNKKIYVMGETGRNQALVMRDQGMSLGDVLGESLGLNPISGSRSKIYVVRNQPENDATDIYHLDLTSIGDFGLANQFAMIPNDIVYVDASGLARWQRVVSQILPFSNALSNVNTLGQ